MSIRRRLSRLEESVPHGEEPVEITVELVMVDVGPDGPVEAEVFRSRYRIHDGVRKTVEELVPIQ